MKSNDLSVAEVRAQYFDADALILPAVKLFRYQHRGNRYYYYLDAVESTGYVPNANVEPELFDAAVAEIAAETVYKLKLAVGVTTVTNKTMPKSEFLTKWIAETGYDEAIEYRDERAKYGSLLHTMCAEFLINRVFDLDLIPEIVTGYCLKNKIMPDVDKWSGDLQTDMLSFGAFVIEHNVKPLAIELSLVYPHYNIAGTMDLYCEMDMIETGFFGEVYKSGERKDQPKESKRTVRILAIVDFKSGRNAADDSHHHAAQLKLLELIFRHHLNTVEMEQPETIRLFNWHPKDWRSKPTYALPERTNDLSTDFVTRKICDYFEYDTNPEDKTQLNINGVMSFMDGVDACYSTQNIMEIIQKRIDANDVPQMEYDATVDYLKSNGLNVEGIGAIPENELFIENVTNE